MKVIKMLILLFVFFSVSSMLATLIPKVDGVDKIAVIPIVGTISYADGTGVAAESVLGYLDAAEKEPTVKAILLEINSGGGAVVASKQIADKIKTLQKPVVSVIEEVGASGAYWIASASDKIVADQLSITGSVGVLGSYIEFAGLMQDYNVTYQKLTGGEFKDIGTPYRELTPLEKEIMQKKINMVHNYFLESVKENRNLSSLNGINTGVYYLGGEAKKLGLIDYFGNKEFAINLTNQLAGTKDAKLVEFKQKKNILDLLNQVAYSFGFNLKKGATDNLVESDIKIIT